jgi:hypothetical protein
MYQYLYHVLVHNTFAEVLMACRADSLTPPVPFPSSHLSFSSPSRALSFSDYLQYVSLVSVLVSRHARGGKVLRMTRSFLRCIRERLFL